MASIFAKVEGASPEQCLVLGPRESLIYPFSAPDWTCLRIGYAMSIGAATGANGSMSYESISFNHPKNGFYIGLKDTGVALPFQTGAVFAGFGTHYAVGGVNTVLYFDGGGNTYLGYNNTNSTKLFCTTGNSFISDLGSYTDMNYFPSPSKMIGSTNYARYGGFEVSITGKNQVGQRLNFRNFQASAEAGTSSVSVAAIRAYLNSPTYISSNGMYLTTGYVVNGGPVPLPEAFFFYMPFFNNVIRLHNIVIERISGSS